MLWDSPEDEQIKQLVNHILGSDLAVYLYPQAFPGKFIKDIQYLEGPAVTGPLYHEVIAPDVVFVLRAQPDAGAVI
jgi:hypothetical protein